MMQGPDIKVACIYSCVGPHYLQETYSFPFSLNDHLSSHAHYIISDTSVFYLKIICHFVPLLRFGSTGTLN